MNINLLADHSHFESVIERLQQQAAVQAKQESYENDSAAVTGEEDVRDTATDNINVWFIIFLAFI